MSAAMIESRQHHIEVQLPDEQLLLSGDGTRLAQVISNLLNNAAKYTPAGGRIRVDAQRKEQLVELRVIDNGIGIRAEELRRIFEPFVQSDHPKDRARDGLGIGLMLARSLLQMHGGDIEARSEGRDSGTEILCRLPLSRQTTAQVEQAVTTTAPAERRLKIVLIEDNRDIRTMMTELLETYGHRVFSAEDGDLGVEMVRAQVPDVAVVDIGLAGKDGYAVARELKQMRSLGGPHPRLIALTGYGRAEDKRRALDAGFDVHLVKPFDPEKFLALLQAPPSC
jgi:CheY-like chemotaxis protein